MAILNITQYSGLAKLPQGAIAQVGQEPALNRQNKTFSTSTEIQLHGECLLVLLTSDTDCYVTFNADGASITAVLGDTLLQANAHVFFGTVGGSKMAVYDGSS